MEKIGGNKKDIGKVDINAVVEELFPADNEDWYEDNELLIDNEEEATPFTAEELGVAIGRLTRKSKKKAPGLDHFTNGIARSCYLADPGKMLKIYNMCLQERTFPDQWKTGRLVLLPKPGASKFRPITLLSVFGKIYETLINNRIKKELANTGYLSGMQFGFREGRPTGDALGAVKKKMRGARKGKRFCCIISFDIKNAFNTIKWRSILEGMEKAGLPRYNQAIVKEHGAGRTLQYTDQNGVERNYPTIRGVPQGSVLGPTLWILTYNAVLRVAESGHMQLIGFADDTLLIVTAKNPYELEDLCNQLIRQIEAIVESMGCEFAGEKTQALFLSPKRTLKREQMEIYVAGAKVNITETIKYLGVIVDDKINFASHVEYLVQKAKKMCGKLAGITRNLRGPKENRRKLYTTIINQVILYAAPVWAPELSKKSRHKINSAQRLANLRQIQGYVTVSGNSAAALANNPPADLLADEAARLDVTVRRIKENEETAINDRRLAICAAKQAAREETLANWNRRWKEEVENWTRRLCDDLTTVNRGSMRSTFRTTQLLTGKGVFNRKAIGKSDTDRCWYCPELEDNPEHTLFHCTE